MKRKFTEEARRIEEEEDWDAIGNDITKVNPVAEKLRGSREYEEALLEKGWHRENCGISVQSRKDWKEQRQEAVDTHTFDFLLFDIIEAELVFWKHYYAYKDEEKFIEDTLDGENDSAQNIVETFVWLRDDLDAPTEHETEQKSLEAIA